MKTCLINLILFLCYATAEDVRESNHPSKIISSLTSPSPSPTCELQSCPPRGKWDFIKCYCVYDPLYDHYPESPSDFTTYPPSKCAPQSCPSGYIWGGNFGGCGCYPACDYITSCPYGETWNSIECRCVIDPTISSSYEDFSTSPSTSCERQSCPRGYLWGGYFGGCGCYLACDYIMSCPYGEKWDFIECRCVNDPTITSTQVSSSSSPSSIYDCWINCPRGYKIDYDRCQCVISDDPNVCNLSCPSDSFPNYETCSCDSTISSSPSPRCDPQSCPRGYYVSDVSGECSCFLACDYIMSCPYGENWDFIECSCVSDPTISSYEDSSSSPPSSDVDFSTSPSSSCEPQACPRGYTWNRYLCSCSLNCQIPKECSKGQEWNATECTCVEIYEEPEDCAAWQVYNAATCDCECPEEPCECVDGFTYNDYYCDCLPIKPSCDRVCAATLFLDDYFCECLDRPCNKSCPQGFIFDVTNCTSCSSCECSVDPDLITSEESSAPSKICDITCPSPNFEVFEPLCNCFCPFESMECPANMTLDIRECECRVPPRCQMFQVCEPGFVFDDILCDCVKEPEPNCTSGFVYDKETCSCVCVKEEDCGDSFVWDENTCQCICPLGQICDPGFIFDLDTCSCICENQFDCEKGFEFNYETCACSCIQSKDCEKDFVWDENTCSCVFGPTPVCDPGFVYDQELCECVCHQNETCEGLKEFDDKVCRCVCPRTIRCEAILNLDDCTCLSPPSNRV